MANLSCAVCEDPVGDDDVVDVRVPGPVRRVSVPANE